jgi:hypothetical protein
MSDVAVTIVLDNSDAAVSIVLDGFVEPVEPGTYLLDFSKAINSMYIAGI